MTLLYLVFHMWKLPQWWKKNWVVLQLEKAKWTRLKKESITTNLSTAIVTGHKRSYILGKNYPELSSTNELVSRGDEVAKSVLVEAGSQPCQPQ